MKIFGYSASPYGLFKLFVSAAVILSGRVAAETEVVHGLGLILHSQLRFDDYGSNYYDVTCSLSDVATTFWPIAHYEVDGRLAWSNGQVSFFDSGVESSKVRLDDSVGISYCEAVAAAADDDSKEPVEPSDFLVTADVPDPYYPTVTLRMEYASLLKTYKAYLDVRCPYEVEGATFWMEEGSLGTVWANGARETLKVSDGLTKFFSIPTDDLGLLREWRNLMEFKFVAEYCRARNKLPIQCKNGESHTLKYSFGAEHEDATSEKFMVVFNGGFLGLYAHKNPQKTLELVKAAVCQNVPEVSRSLIKKSALDRVASKAKFG